MLYARSLPLIVAVVVVVAVVLGVSIYTYWQQTIAPAGGTVTVTETTTKTITQTVLSTITVRETITVTAVQPTVTTITPPTTIPVNTITLPPTPKPPSKTPSNTTTWYNSSGIVEVLAWTQSAPIDLKAYGSSVFPIPRNANVSDIASKLDEYLKAGSRKLTLTNTSIQVSITQDNDLGVVLMLYRGNPCVQYGAEIVDGDPSDGVVRVRVEKYSTAQYCIQVVPTDNQYVALLVIRNPGLQTFTVEITYSDGVRTIIVDLHVTQQ